MKSFRAIYYRMLFSLIVGATVDVLLWLAGVRTGFVWLLVPVAAAGILTLAGEVLFLSFGISSLRGWLPASFVAGTSVTSVAMIAPTFFLHWTAQNTFLGWSGLVILAGVWARHRLVRNAAMVLTDLGAASLFSIFVVFFSLHQAVTLPALMTKDILQVWDDYFIHGMVVASFGDPRATWAGDIMLSGSPQAFYHYGIFMLPAALQPVTGLCGLGLATAVMLPLGLLVGLFGLYSLAAEWAGVGTALLGLWLVCLLPDASRYWMRNPFYGFHWSVYTSPGAGYAIGLCGVSFGCALGWLRGRQLGALLLSGFLTFLLVMIRAHLFLLMAPALAGTIVLSFLNETWRKRIVMAGCLAAFVLTILLLNGKFGRYGSERAQPFTYIQWVYTMGPDHYADLFGRSVQHFGQPFSAIVGGIGMLPVTLGFWAILFPLAIWWEGRHGRFKVEDYFLPLATVAYLLLIFWAPIAYNGTLDEYKQRSFVLLYALVVLWTGLRLIGAVGIDRYVASWRPAVSAMTAAAVLLTTVLLYRNTDPGSPVGKIVAWNAYDKKIDPGVVQMAVFLNANAHPKDMIAVGGKGAYETNSCATVELASMTDLPVYVGRIDFQLKTRSPQTAQIIQERAAEMKMIDGAADQAKAFEQLRSHGIRWYVCSGSNMPSWDRVGKRSVFHADSTYVYDAAKE